MRTRFLVAATALGVGLLAGCSANVAASADGADADAPSAATALVSVDSVTSVPSGTAGATGSGGDRKVSAVARFVRVREGVVDEDALRMVHASLTLPDLGSCSVPQTEPASARVVSLADLGNVSLESAGTSTPLVPRELPDVADLVDGVVYTSRAVDGEALPASAAYIVRASGSESVPAFAVQATAPAEIHGLKLGGVDADLDPAELSVDPGASLDLSWDADGAVARDRDEVYVDVAADGASDAPVVRCAFADSGHADLPPSAWAALGRATTGEVTVHRLHREPLRASGMGAGEVRFDFARQVPFRVR